MQQAKKMQQDAMSRHGKGQASAGPNNYQPTLMGRIFYETYI
jgi:hypothetical protein